MSLSLSLSTHFFLYLLQGSSTSTVKSLATKKKKKATDGVDSTNGVVLVKGNEAKQEWCRIIKEPVCLKATGHGWK